MVVRKIVITVTKEGNFTVKDFSLIGHIDGALTVYFGKKNVKREYVEEEKEKKNDR